MNSTSSSIMDTTTLATLANPVTWINLVLVLGVIGERIMSKVKKSKCCGGEIDMRESGSVERPSNKEEEAKPKEDTEAQLVAQLDAVRRSKRLADLAAST